MLIWIAHIRPNRGRRRYSKEDMPEEIRNNGNDRASKWSLQNSRQMGSCSLRFYKILKISTIYYLKVLEKITLWNMILLKDSWKNVILNIHNDWPEGQIQRSLKIVSKISTISDLKVFEEIHFKISSIIDLVLLS